MIIESKSKNPKKAVAVINYETDEEIAFVVDTAFYERGRKEGNFLVANLETLKKDAKARLGVDPYISVEVSRGLEAMADCFKARFFELGSRGNVYAYKYRDRKTLKRLFGD